MSIPGKKDRLAAGARSMVIAGGVGESPLMAKIAAEEAAGVVEVEQPVEAFERQEKPAAPRKQFNPNPGVYLVRQFEADSLGYGSFEEAMQANVDTKKVIGVQDEVNKEKPSEGIILRAGAGTLHVVGTHVLFGKYSGTQFKLNGETLLHMREDDIIGSITDEEIETETEVFPGLENVGYTVGRA
jgi:chaperonin GroES